MDIKIEPDDGLLSSTASEKRFYGVESQVNMTFKRIEGHSTTVRHNVTVKNEQFDQDDNKLGGSEMNNHWVNFQQMSSESDSPTKLEKIDVDECSNEGNPLEKNLATSPQIRRGDLGLKNEINVDQGCPVKTEKSEDGECSYAEWIPGEVPEINGKSSTDRQNPLIDSPEIHSSLNEWHISVRDPVVVIMLEKCEFYKRNFICRECFEICKSAQSLSKHKLAHSETYNTEQLKELNGSEDLNCSEEIQPYDFVECDMKIQEHCQDNQMDIKIYSIVDDKEKPFACDLCNFRSAYAHNLKTHKKSHTGEKPFSCDQCDFKSARSFDLKTHKMSHTGEKPFECDQCGTRFARATHLKRHQITHNGLERFKCDQCNLKFVKLTKLRKHRKIHVGEKSFKCSVCDFKCVHLSTLKTHLTSHTTEKPYTCSQCDFKSAYRYNLKTHLKSHTGEKPFNCDMCDFKSARSFDLKVHKRSHTGEKPFKCEKCGWKFARATHLKRHESIHAGEKPFKCEECDKRFYHLDGLKKHQLSHSTEKSLKCDQCDYKSARLFDLKKHKRLHIDFKPFKCDICDSEFERAIHLKRHKATHAVAAV